MTQTTLTLVLLTPAAVTVLVLGIWAVVDRTLGRRRRR
jgi:hypothetical protein